MLVVLGVIIRKIGFVRNGNQSLIGISAVRANYFGAFLKRGHLRVLSMTYLADQNHAVRHGMAKRVQNASEIEKLGVQKEWMEE